MFDAGINGADGTFSNSSSTTYTYPAFNQTLYAIWEPVTTTISLSNQSATTAGTTAIYNRYAMGTYTDKTFITSVTSITPPTKTGYKIHF